MWNVVNERNINVNLGKHLVKVVPDRKEAIFADVADPKQPLVTVDYEMLHVTPPMSTPDVLRKCESLVDDLGFVDVDPQTLQHKRYKNVFAIGDCSNVPTGKTAAAVASELGVLRKNLKAVMDGKSALEAKYDGYASCPLVTGPGECILAEFDNSTPPQPLETFPFNQAVPRQSMYEMKAHVMPQVYWQMLQYDFSIIRLANSWIVLFRGRWEGPRYVRKLMHLGMSK